VCDGNVATCSRVPSTNRLECLDGYGPTKNGRCVKCARGCDYCPYNKNECYGCSVGYYNNELGGKCKRCPDRGCAYCGPTKFSPNRSPATCVECKAGYGLTFKATCLKCSDSLCIKCPGGDAAKCSVCKAGYAADATGKCMPA